MNILKHLEKYGYAIQENVISSKECSKMSKALDSLKIKKEKNGSLLSTSSQTVIKNVHLEQPEVFLNKISLPKVMDIASKVLQDEFILSNFNASLSGKTGGSRVHIDSRVPISDFKSTLHLIYLTYIVTVWLTKFMVWIQEYLWRTNRACYSNLICICLGNYTRSN